MAERITAAEQEVRAGEGQARDAAILNSDIRGFTRYAVTVAPGELMATLAEYQTRLVPIIQYQGGTIDKFMGDGIMAIFGASVTTDTYAADALRAVDHILAAADEWNAGRKAAGKPALGIGVGLASGRIIFGAVGDTTRLEYTVIGETVNLAAKLEKHNKAEGVRAMTTVAAFELVRAQGYEPPAEPVRRDGRTIEGVDAPVDVMVLARPEAGSRLAVAAPRGQPRDPARHVILIAAVGLAMAALQGRFLGQREIDHVGKAKQRRPCEYCGRTRYQGLGDKKQDNAADHRVAHMPVGPQHHEPLRRVPRRRGTLPVGDEQPHGPRHEPERRHRGR